MITAVRSWLAIAVAVVTLGGCAASSQVQEIGWGLIGQYGTKMSEQVKYDPYSARVYFDEAQMQGIFNEMVFAMEVNGCSVSTFEPYGDYDDNGGDDYFAREVRFDNLEWKRALFDQLETGRGWGIAQSRYSEAAKHHGEYAVPIAIQFFIGWCGQDLIHPLI